MGAERPIVIGLDMGTGGARAIAMDLAGAVVGTGRADLPLGAAITAGACVEQDPRAWTDAARSALRQVVAGLPADSAVVGVSVDATSGTFLLADADEMPITPGLMYNDLRAAEQVPRAAEAIDKTLRPYGISIAAAFALPKILHLAETEPQVFARCRRVIHQTDWIVGMLCGRYDVTDVSTALKTGADPGRLAWPEAIENKLGVPLSLLPTIVLPGTRIGEVTANAAALTGLPAGTPVVAGCTDGTAGALASGAGTAGDLNVTLGTTLVFKAVADTPLIDSTGAIYNHRHPAGGYLPGAASSAGGEWVPALTGTAGLNTLGRQAAALIPTGHLAYPLVKKGERFPFACPQAEGFGLDEIESLPERFAAGMEGIAFLERLSIDRFEELGLRVGDTIYATGGGSYGETWLRIRASAAQRVYAVPEQRECAVGAAILAAAAHSGGVGQAIRSMVRIAQRFEPDGALVPAYEDGCRRFRDELRRRGWM